MSTGDAKGFRFRESTRAPYKTPVSLRFERDGETTSGYSANVSMEGMFVETNDPRPVGTLVQFEFQLEAAAVQGLGDVVWIRTRPLGADKPPGMGVQFRYVDPQSRDLIARIVDRYLQEGKEPSASDAGPQVLPIAPAEPSVEEAHADPMDALLAESVLSTSAEPSAPAPPEPAVSPAPAAPPEPLAVPSEPIAVGAEDQDAVGEVEMLEIRPARSRRWIWIAAAGALIAVFAAWWFGLVGGRGDTEPPLAQALSEPEPRARPARPTPVEPEPATEIASSEPAEEAERETAAEAEVRSSGEAMPELDEEEDFSSDFAGLDEEPLEPLPGSESVPPPTASAPATTRPEPPSPSRESPTTSTPLRLQSVEATPSEGGTVVSIRGSAPIAVGGYSSLRLTGPPRLLLRVDGITEPIDTRGVRAPEFQALRAGLHRGQGGSQQIHLVFDLASESVRTSVELDDGVLRVRLRP